MISLLLCSHTPSTPRVISVDRFTRKATKSTPKKRRKRYSREKKVEEEWYITSRSDMAVKCLCDHRFGALPGSERGAKGLSEGKSAGVRVASTACSNIKTFPLVGVQETLSYSWISKNPLDYISRPQPRHLLGEPTAALSEQPPRFTTITVKGLFFATC